MDLKEIRWEAIKELCDRVAGFEARAKEKGLRYTFEVRLGITPASVYSVLYKRLDNGRDFDLVKFSEWDYFEKQTEFEKHLAEVEKILTQGWSVEEAYKEELAKLNEKYGK